MLPRSFAGIKKKLGDNELTVSSVVKQYLQNIAEHNSSLNAFVEVYEEQALESAALIDQKLKEGKAGALAGMVFGIKDLFCLENHSLSCSSKILQGFESQITATPIKRLLEQDAIIIGRQNCDEFGMGSSNENSFFGPVRNQIDTDRVPGGSSGGSAVAVQANMCLLSVASDTGGSIRQPAAFTGTFGLKPTYSRISRYGLTAYSSSFDCVGFIANSTDDLAYALQYASGYDENDSTSSMEPAFVPGRKLDKEISVFYFEKLIHQEGVEKGIIETFNRVLKNISQQDRTSIHEEAFEYADFLLPIYYILTSAEASANLSRFDGVRYGYRADGIESIEDLYKKSRTKGFGSEVIRRILLGTFVLSANYQDAFYLKAMKARALIKKSLKTLFTKYDFLVLPTTPTVAFELGAKTSDPIEMYLSDVFTTLASIGGFPAISVPVGTNDDGLPVGVQVIGDEFKEADLLLFSERLRDL